MKMIKNLILSFIFIVCVMFIYMNFDSTYNSFINLFKKETIITIPESNSYKRKYDYERFTHEEDYIPSSKSDIENIFYNILNNGWEEFTFYCPFEYESCEEDIEIISSDTSTMSNIAGYVSPFNTFNVLNTIISSNGEVYVSIDKKYNEEEINLINNKLDSLFIELNISSLSKEEKIKVLHDYLIKNTIYDETFAETKKSKNNPTKANGALIEGKAVCGGYADAMSIILDRLNIPNIIISSENHAWNLIYLDDSWLHLDPTWNDTENDKHIYEFYLIKSEELNRIDTTEHLFDTNFFIEAF